MSGKVVRIAKDNPEAATRVIEAAKVTFKAPAQNPSLGNMRRFHDRRLRDICSWGASGFKNYVILYRICP
jgi:plasmid stabilization system protein ParE